MKTIFAIMLAALLFSCTKTMTDKTMKTFELRLAETEPGSNLQEMIFESSGRKFFVHDSVYLTNADIRAAEVVEWRGRPNIKVMLNEEGRRKFADFTSSNVGKNAAMIVSGSLVSAPKINAQITKGVLIIDGFFSRKEAQEIADEIQPFD